MNTMIDYVEETMKEKFDLVKLLNILKKNIKLLLILPAICLVVSAALTFFVMPDKYTASTQILVNMKKSSSDLAFQNVQSSLQSVNTYTEIIKSPRILDKVSREFDGQYSTAELNSFLKVTNQTLKLLLYQLQLGINLNLTKLLIEYLKFLHMTCLKL